MIYTGRPAPESDDFGFGSYMPSAAASSGSRPSSRRSVRLEIVICYL